MQAVSSELYKAASEKARAAQGQAGGQQQGGPGASGPQGRQGGRQPKGKDEGPIIDAEVVDEKKKKSVTASCGRLPFQAPEVYAT